MGVGVLGDEARVVGGDAAEPVCSGRGHLEEAADRISHQRVTLSVRKIYILIIYDIYLHPELKRAALRFSVVQQRAARNQPARIQSIDFKKKEDTSSTTKSQKGAICSFGEEIQTNLIIYLFHN